MTPEIINLSEALDDIIHKLRACSAVIADLAEMYPLKYNEEDHAVMASTSDRLEDAFFAYNMRMQVFTTNLAKYGRKQTDIRKDEHRDSQGA